MPKRGVVLIPFSLGLLLALWTLRFRSDTSAVPEPVCGPTSATLQADPVRQADGTVAARVESNTGIGSPAAPPAGAAGPAREWPPALRRIFRADLDRHLAALDAPARTEELGRLLTGTSSFIPSESICREFGDYREIAAEDSARQVTQLAEHEDVLRLRMLPLIRGELERALADGRTGHSVMKALTAVFASLDTDAEIAALTAPLILTARKSPALRGVLAALPPGIVQASPAVVETLKSVIQESPDVVTRQLAVIHLSTQADSDACTFRYLESHYGEFPEILRAAALTGISQADDRCPEVRAFVRQAVLTESSDAVRSRAVGILARSPGAVDPEILRFVRASLTSDTAPLRASAIEYLCRKGDSDDAARIGALADTDPDPFVRKKAAAFRAPYAPRE
jgi:hypothetical protein